jgi:hypothetical protein
MKKNRGFGSKKQSQFKACPERSRMGQSPAFGRKSETRRTPARRESGILINKANFIWAQMNVTTYQRRDYGDFAALELRKN